MTATLPEEKQADARAALELGAAIVGEAGAPPTPFKPARRARGPVVGAGGLTVDLKLAANRAAHHTAVFDGELADAAILRRGQPWRLGIAGAATAGLAGVLTDAHDARNTFSLRIEPVADAENEVDVWVAPDAPVGRFTLALTAGGEGGASASFAVTVLFNA